MMHLSTLDLDGNHGVNWDEIYRLTKNALHYYLDERIMFSIKERIKSNNEYKQLNTFTVSRPMGLSARSRTQTWPLTL